MGAKRRAAAPANPAGGSPGKRQQTLLEAAAPPPRCAPPPLEAAAPPAPELERALLQDLEQAVEAYQQAWGEKCEQSSCAASGGAARAEVALDAAGLRAVAAFRHAGALAAARGASLPSSALEALALVTRCDVVHARSGVSRAAAAALAAHLAARPYARLERAGAGGAPRVVTDARAAWVPLDDANRRGFTWEHLMVPDMALSGRAFAAERRGGAPPPPPAGGRTGARRATRWATPLELVQHCVDAARLSDKEDRNGDLLLWEYLLRVLEQDLAARLEAHAALRPEAEAAAAAGDGARAARRKVLLQHSLAWRVLACDYASPEQRRGLVRGLAALVVADAEAAAGGAPAGGDDALAAAEEEPEDDAPAGACVFTRRELAALAARTLRAMLSLHGAAEGAGDFFAAGKHRAAAVNHRTALDAALLDELWMESGVVRAPGAGAALLRALAPRDALRLLGLHLGRRFAKTYADQVGPFKKLFADIAPALEAAAAAPGRGTELATFFEADLVASLASLHREPGRTVLVHKSAEHVAAMLGAGAAAAAALVVAGEPLPAGAAPAAVAAELRKAAAAAPALAGSDRSAAHALGRAGAAQLVAARMAADALAAA
jgi:hypothetical protein